MIRNLSVPAMIVLALAGCAATPPTGYVLGFGSPSDGYEVTFIEGTPGYAYWCSASQTCIARATSACNNNFTVRDISEIDPAQSGDTRDFFQKAATDLETFAVTCAIDDTAATPEAITVDPIETAPLDTPTPG